MAEINKLIVKFLNQEANHSELEKLENQLKNEEGIRIFNNYVKTQYLSTLSMTKYDVDKAKETIKTRLKKDKLTRRVNLYKKIAVAASIMLMFGMAFYMIYNNGHVKPIEPEKQPHLIVTGTDKAILTLENGDEVALEKGKKYQTGKVSSNGEELVYTDKGQSDIAEKGQLYNYLTIPRGGQFFVKLSDGTEVWLNSETKLKYPVKFIEGISRNVELLYGEAYFKVSPSTAHKY